MYVSCSYAPPDPTLDANLKSGENARITCIDDQGRVWWLAENSEVGDWLEFKAKGGSVVRESRTPNASQASGNYASSYIVNARM